MRRLLLVWLSVCLAFGLSGCITLDSSDLLTLPEISPGHKQLLRLINAETASDGWTTANPIAGENRLTMQFVDFFGDGIPEAVAFFRNSKTLQLRTALYARTGASSYTPLCSFDLTGDQFQRMDYADLNGDGCMELLVSIRLDTAAVYELHVFALQNSAAVELLTTTYTDLAVFDLDGDGGCDILTINASESSAELFSADGQAIISRGTAPLSAEVRAPSSVQTGYLNESMPAVIADGTFTDATGSARYLSDVFVCEPDGSLVNLSYAEIFHQSFETQRTVSYPFSDSDFDGFLEFPIAIPQTDPLMMGQYVRWYGYRADGSILAKSDTYHFSDGSWYFLLPDSWRDTVQIREINTNGCTGVLFTYEVGGLPQELLTLYLCASEDALRSIDAEGIAATFEYRDILYAIRLPRKLSGVVPSGLYLADADDAMERIVFHTASGDAIRASRLSRG